MASLIRSAAEPCKGEFWAFRSPYDRRLKFRSFISGM